MDSVLNRTELEIEMARYEHILDRATGLPKWSILIDRLSVALARARRTGLLVALFVLDDPKLSAHRSVDLEHLATRLQAKLRPDDTLARIGARRLAVVLSDMHADEDAALIARRLLQSTQIVCRLGVALSDSASTPSTLLFEALRQAEQIVPIG